MPGRHAGERGRSRVISIKARAGRLLFMALTLIVLSVTRPGIPQPSLRVRHLLYLWEGGVGSSSLQSGFSSCFPTLCERKTPNVGPLEEASALPQPGVSAGMRWEPPACSELALALEDPHTPSKFASSFLSCTSCSRTPIEFFSRMEQGRKPEPLL